MIDSIEDNDETRTTESKAADDLNVHTNDRLA